MDRIFLRYVSKSEGVIFLLTFFSSRYPPCSFKAPTVFDNKNIVYIDVENWITLVVCICSHRVVAADGVGRGVHVRPPGDELHVVQADGADVRGQLLQCVDIARYCVDIATNSW